MAKFVIMRRNLPGESGESPRGGGGKEEERAGQGVSRTKSSFRKHLEESHENLLNFFC